MTHVNGKGEHHQIISNILAHNLTLEAKIFYKSTGIQFMINTSQPEYPYRQKAFGSNTLALWNEAHVINYLKE